MKRFSHIHRIGRRIVLALSLMLVLTTVFALPARAAETGYAKCRHEWQRHDRKGNLWIEYYIHRDTYQHYADLDRVYGFEHITDYVNDPVNRELVANLVKDCFEPMPDFTGFSRDEVVEEMVRFVQKEIEYKLDWETTDLVEFPRYPIETLYLGYGDCEDSSILLASMLREYGYSVALLQLPGHIAVAIRTDADYRNGPYYETENGRYLFIESTNDQWKIGQIPQEYLECSADFCWL